MICLDEISVQAITVTDWIHSLNKESNNIICKPWCWCGGFPVFRVENTRAILATFLELADMIISCENSYKKNCITMFFQLKKKPFRNTF